MTSCPEDTPRNFGRCIVAPLAHHWQLAFSSQLERVLLSITAPTFSTTKSPFSIKKNCHHAPIWNRCIRITQWHLFIQTHICTRTRARTRTRKAYTHTKSHCLKSEVVLFWYKKRVYFYAFVPVPRSTLEISTCTYNLIPQWFSCTSLHR